MHSAKEVIYNELKEQETRGQLNILEIVENDISLAQTRFFIIGMRFRIGVYNITIRFVIWTDHRICGGINARFNISDIEKIQIDIDDYKEAKLLGKDLEKSQDNLKFTCYLLILNVQHGLYSEYIITLYKAK